MRTNSSMLGRLICTSASLLILLGGVSACGQKGPLYLPDPAQPDKVENCPNKRCTAKPRNTEPNS